MNTRVVAGIDEAGLGPLLGPLTFGLAVFAVPDGDADLWSRLDAAVTDQPRRDRDRLVVADSKKVYTRNPRGRARLESTVLAFLEQLPGGAPANGAGLVRGRATDPAPTDDDLARHPWYEELPPALPQWCDDGLLRLHAGRLERALAAADVRFLTGATRVVPAGELNRSYAETRNKAKTVWSLLADLLRHVWTVHAEDGVTVHVDRQGGRAHYAAPLLATFTRAEFECLEESDGRSVYTLQDGTRRMHLTFAERAEDASLPVALASCFAKYARETVMGAFNRWFEHLQPGLSPTAGYTTDARRWLAEAGPALQRAGVPREMLVRER